MGGSLGKSESQAQQQAQSNSSANSSLDSTAYGSNSGYNRSQFGQNVFGPQSGALSNMYGQTGGLFDQTNQQMQGQIPGAINQMQGVFNNANPAWQQQLGGGAYQGMDLQGNYNQDRQGGGNEQFIDQSIMGGAGNNYAQAMQGQLQDESSQRLGRDLAMNDARAAGNGMSGSSRHGITEARLYDDAGDRLANQQTNIGFDSFDKDLDRKLGIAQRADQFDMGRLQQSGQMLGAANQTQQGAINQGGTMQNLGMGQFAPSNAPWGAAGQYSAGLGDPTVLGQGSGNASTRSNDYSNSSANSNSTANGISMGTSDSKGLGASGGVKGGK